MAINLGETGRTTMSEMNLTPMIDVLLVLLVIFMLAVPLLERAVDLQVPIERKSTAPPPVTPIVLEIAADGSYMINQQRVPPGRLVEWLRGIYSGRPDKVLFVKADGGLVYQDVISACDDARGAGVTVIGIVLPAISEVSSIPGR